MAGAASHKARHTTGVKAEQRLEIGVLCRGVGGIDEGRKMEGGWGWVK